PPNGPKKPSSGRKQVTRSRFVGDDAVDHAAAERCEKSRILTLSLGKADDRRRLARRQRHGGDAFVDAAFEQLAVPVEHPAADFAGGSLFDPPRHFLGMEEAVEAQRRMRAEFADTDKGDVRLAAELQRRL